MTLTSPTRQSMRAWSETSQPAPSSPISAMSCWSAAPEPANRIWRSPLPARSPLGSNQWRLNGSLRNSTGGRFYNVVDLVNRLETETRSGKQGRLADYLNRLDFPPRENDPPDRFLVLVDPRRAWLSPLRSGRWPVAVPPDQQTLRTHVRHRHHQPHLRRMANGLRGRQDDHRATRPPHPSLRDRRNRQRVLALQKPRLTPPDLGLARLRHMTHSVGPDPNPTPQRGSKLRAD